jgi:hypothetical protein
VLGPFFLVAPGQAALQMHLLLAVGQPCCFLLGQRRLATGP